MDRTQLVHKQNAASWPASRRDIDLRTVLRNRGKGAVGVVHADELAEAQGDTFGLEHAGARRSEQTASSTEILIAESSLETAST